MAGKVMHGVVSDPESRPEARLNAVARSAVLRSWMIAVAIIVGIHLPLLYVQAKWLWGRPHYQFFPVILIGFLWLVAIRLPWIQLPANRYLSARILLCAAASLLLFTAGVWLNSGLLGWISCVLGVWASVWYFGGFSGARELAGPFLFLALVLPLPLNLDLQLISSLQLTASEMASTALDLRGIRHSLSGVVIRTATESFMVEEACSGINSLFSATALMLGFGVYARYGLVRILLVLSTTVLWVVVANAVRVFLVVFCDARYGVRLDLGWRHDALGVFTYCLAVVMSLSTDQFFRFLLPAGADSVAELRAEFASRYRFPLFRWIRRQLDSPLSSSPMILISVFVICFAGLVSVGWAASSVLLVSPARNLSELKSPTGSEHDLVDQESLPQSVQGWNLVGFETVKRGPDDPSGLHSTMWQYEGNGFRCVFSLDGYYKEWHDLAYCYTGVGWQLLDAQNGASKAADGTPIFHTRLQLIRKPGNHAVVFFSCFDSVRTPVKPPPVSGSFVRMLQQRLLTGFRYGGRDVELEPPIFQLQLIVDGDREFLPHEQEEFLKFFQSQCQTMLSQLKGRP